MAHTLRTDRLLLRGLTARDAAVAARIFNDWDVVKQTESWSYPVDEARTRWRFAQFAAIPLREGVVFAMIADAGLIGTIGLHRRVGTTFGLGYMIGKSYWGRGYGSEAARALCRFGFETMGVRLIQADVFQDNAASARVLEKAGFRYVRDPGPGWSATRGANYSRHEYELTRQDLAL